MIEKEKIVPSFVKKPKKAENRFFNGASPQTQPKLNLTEKIFKDPSFNAVSFVETLFHKFIPFQEKRNLSPMVSNSDKKNESIDTSLHISHEDNEQLDFELDPLWCQTFETMQSALSELKTRVERSTVQLTKDCSHLECDLKNKLNELTQRVDSCLRIYHDLDTRMSRISSTAVRVGGTLESVELQRMRAVELHLLLQHIIDLNDTSKPLPSNLSDPDFITHKNAILVKQLALVTSELDLPQFQTAKTRIRELYNSVETTLLQRFVNALNPLRISVLHETAHTLFEFNGGESCVTAYFQDLFTHRLTLPQIEWSNDQHLAENLTTYLDSIARTVCKEYNQVVKCVFPNPTHIVTQLIHRVRDIHFRGAIDSALQCCEHNSERLLQVCMEAVQCVSRIALDFTQLIPDIKRDELIRPLFTSYLSQYVKRETLAMSEAFSQLSNSFTNHTSSSTSSHSPFQPLTGYLLLPFFIRLELGITRALTLSLSDSLASNVGRIFSFFIREVGFKYILNALDITIKHMIESEKTTIAKSDAVSDGIDTFFRVVTVINTFTVMLQKNFYLHIKPHVKQSRNDYTLCITEKNKLLIALEDRINEGIRHSINLFHSRVKKALQHQQKHDFQSSKSTPRNSVTRACSEVCGLIRRIQAIVSNALDGDNVTTVLSEFANLILNTLLEHITKFTISQGEGSLTLLRDMKAYIETIEPFGSKIVERFAILESVAKLHLVAPNQLATLIRETPLHTLPSSLLHKLIERREDYSPSWWGQILPKSFE